MSAENALFVENCLVVTGLAPMADIYNGNPKTDVVSLRFFRKCVFLLSQKTAGTNTGTATVKPQAVDNVAASNAADLPFIWSKKTSGASDVWSTPARVTAGNSLTTTANEDTIYAIEVDSADLPDAQAYVHLALTEAVNDPVTGGVQIILLHPRYGSTFPGALT